MAEQQQQSTHEAEAEEISHPLRIVPLDRVHSTTTEPKPLIVYQRKRKRGTENKNQKSGVTRRSKELEKLVSGLELTTTGERSRLRGIGRKDKRDKNGENSSRKRKRGGLSSRGSCFTSSSWVGKKWVE